MRVVMEIEKLSRRLVLGDGEEYTIVRPGISLCLHYGEPAERVAPAIATILEEYIQYIPPGALQTYLGADGRWKKATKRTFTSILKNLRSVGPGEYAGFHLGQEPIDNVGNFGGHFFGSPLQDPFFTLKTCLLYLEFPADVSDFSSLDALEGFVRRVALAHRFDSGYCGYAFKHLQMTFDHEAAQAIGRMAM